LPIIHRSASILFIPDQLGGPDLRSPFISLFLVLDHLVDDPGELMRCFLMEEKEADKPAKAVVIRKARRRRWAVHIQEYLHDHGGLRTGPGDGK